MDVNLPNYLYKYSPIVASYEKGKKSGLDVIENLLVNGFIYYSDPKNFNDPYEFQRVTIRLSQQHIESSAQEIINDELKRGTLNRELFIQHRQAIITARMNAIRTFETERHNNDKNTILHRIGYISLCTENDNILMWAHYADKHKGICFRFNCTDDPFWSEGKLGRCVRINYGDTIDDIFVDPSLPSDASFDKMCRKAKCWKYENEFRAYKVPSSPDSNDAQGDKPFNSQLIDEVYFGINASDDDIQEVLSIIKRAKHTITPYKARTVKKRLSIKFNPI